MNKYPQGRSFWQGQFFIPFGGSRFSYSWWKSFAQLGSKLFPLRVAPFEKWYELIVLGFNDMSTLVGHFVSSPREREKRDKRDSRGEEREGQERKRKMNESEEIKTIPSYPYLLQGQQALPSCQQISDGRPSDAKYTTPLPYPTIPKWYEYQGINFFYWKMAAKTFSIESPLSEVYPLTLNSIYRTI